MGGLSGFTDWVSDTVSDVFDAVGDAFEWVGDKISDIWESDLGKIAMIAAAVYFGGVVLTGEWGWLSTAVEPTAALAETNVLAAGSTEMTAAASGAQLGAGTEVGVGALEAAEGAAAMEPVAGAGAVDLTLAGGAETGIGMTVGGGAGEVGALDAAATWASENPMLAYGGMMAGGQAVSGYMQGEQMKEMEKQRLKEEQEERDRQNVWGVNYAEGGEPIGAGDRLKDLNRDYFDSQAPINPAVQDYKLPSERARMGALEEVTSTANPEQYAHRPGVA